MPFTHSKNTSGTTMVIAAGASKKQQNTINKTTPVEHTGPHHNTSLHNPSENLKSKRLQAKALHQKAATTDPPLPLVKLPPSAVRGNDQPRAITERSTETEMSRKLLGIINSIPTPSLPETARDRLSGGGEWSNYDLDEAFNMLRVNCLPARFLVDLQADPSTTINLLKSKMNAPLYLPLWIRHHWLLGIWRAGTLTLADSSPGIARKEDIEALLALFTHISQTPTKLEWCKVPKQPRSSVECGLHVTINLVLMTHQLLQTAPVRPPQNTIEYERTLGSSVAKWLADEMHIAELVGNILLYLAETGVELLSQQEVLAICDGNTWNTPLEVTWVEVTEHGNELRTWTGHLTKRRAASWSVTYEERKGIFSIPSPNVNYLAVKVTNNDLHEDVLSKNILVPSNTATLDGDSLKVADIRSYLQSSEVEYSKLFKAATAPSTRRNHNSMLKLLDAMPTTLDYLYLPTAILHFIQARASARQWKASTLVTKLATIQGALKLLPFYRTSAPAITLTSTIWRIAMRGASFAANAEIPDQAPILQQHHMDRMIASHNKGEPDPHAALVEIAWLVAGRIGDVAQLAPQDISWDTENTIIVRFRRGKTARRGQYSIATSAPSPQTTRYIQSRQAELWLFPQIKSEAIKDHLRKHISVHGIECRSIRRGRLQLLSARGMDDEELLHVSRHQTLGSLRRYLNFGTKSGENLRRAKRIQDVLDASASETSSRSSSSPTHTD